VAIGLLAAGALAACGGDEPAPEAGGPAPGIVDTQAPLWKQPPDKPLGPAPPREAGGRRSFALRAVADGLTAPNQLVARPGDRRLFVVEQGGTVRTLPGRRLWLDLGDRTVADGERGLLSLAFALDGATAYVLHTTAGAGDTRVLEIPVRDGAAALGEARTILAVEQPYENHKGGTLLVDERDRLVLGLGDGGSAFDPQQRAQDPDAPLGKLLRRDGGRWETVATGLRNPFRMSFDRATGRLWVGDVGQDRVEEVDALFLPETGAPVPNLGWAAYEGDLPVGRKRLATDPSRLTWPVASYLHRDGHCSVTGGFVARGAAPPALRGRYVFGDFCRGTIWSLDAAGAEDRDRVDLRREAERVPGLVSFGEDGAGRLFAVSIQGEVLQLIPTA
jgi:glucose/arabinose dehydrogenase